MSSLGLDKDDNTEEPQNLQDAFNTVFGDDPTRLFSMVQNVGEKVKNKMNSGELSHNDLLNEAQSMMTNMQSNPIMSELFQSDEMKNITQNIQHLFQNMGGGGGFNMNNMMEMMGGGLSASRRNPSGGASRRGDSYQAQMRRMDMQARLQQRRQLALQQQQQQQQHDPQTTTTTTTTKKKKRKNRKKKNAKKRDIPVD